MLQANLSRETGELDAMIDKWLETSWNCKIDFKIDHALKKLQRPGLVTRNGAAPECLPLKDAKSQLDHVWDNYFEFNSNRATFVGVYCLFVNGY